MKNPKPNHVLRSRIMELEAIHGGLRAAARVIGISAVYLGRMRDGRNNNPSDKILKRMGLKRQVIFLRVNEGG